MGNQQSETQLGTSHLRAQWNRASNAGKLSAQHTLEFLVRLSRRMKLPLDVQAAAQILGKATRNIDYDAMRHCVVELLSDTGRLTESLNVDVLADDSMGNLWDLHMAGKEPRAAGWLHRGYQAAPPSDGNALWKKLPLGCIATILCMCIDASPLDERLTAYPRVCRRWRDAFASSAKCRSLMGAEGRLLEREIRLIRSLHGALLVVDEADLASEAISRLIAHTRNVKEPLLERYDAWNAFD